MQEQRADGSAEARRSDGGSGFETSTECKLSEGGVEVALRREGAAAGGARVTLLSPGDRDLFLASLPQPPPSSRAHLACRSAFGSNESRQSARRDCGAWSSRAHARATTHVYIFFICGAVARAADESLTNPVAPGTFTAARLTPHAHTCNGPYDRQGGEVMARW